MVPSGATAGPVKVEDHDGLEDIFATIQLPIGLLNMDYAGNNIRNLGRVREVLANWNNVRTATSGAASKQRSELKLLGFADGRELTELGRAASEAGSREAVAALWCTWLQGTADAVLAGVNNRLLVAKRVFTQFRQLHPEVRGYFLANAESPADRQTLRTIELLCNARDVVQELSLDDIQTLTPLLGEPQRVPQFVRAAIADYQDNKGMRGWDFPDRRIVPVAWRQAAEMA